MAEQKNDAQKATEAAAKADEKTLAAKREAELAALSPEERKVREAEDKADDARAKAAEAKEQEARDNAPDPQVAEDTKNAVAATEPDRKIGDHHAQKFANDPANPQLAPGLDPADVEKHGVRLEITDSDHPDPANPKVAIVHREMVGDYLRAGWRHPVAG